MPRIAFCDPFEGKPAPFQCSVLLDGKECILGAAGVKTAALSEKWADGELVEADEIEADLFHIQ